MKNDYNKILDQLMEKISKAVADEQYAEVILYNEELCKAVVEMTESCSEEDKESLYMQDPDSLDLSKLVKGIEKPAIVCEWLNLSVIK